MVPRLPSVLYHFPGMNESDISDDYQNRDFKTYFPQAAFDLRQNIHLICLSPMTSIH